MQLSLKQKTFFEYFVPFVQSTSIFKHFEKKDDRRSYFILEITDCRRLGYFFFLLLVVYLMLKNK